METKQAILTRKSVRSFSDKPVSDEIIEELLRAGMAAPTGMNKQPWMFYVCKSEESRKAVINAMPFGKYKAPIIIITCVKENEVFPLKRDLANCDLSAASENILLMAHDLGLGGVWCAIYPGNIVSGAIRKAINIPKGITPFSALYIGYPSENDKSEVKEKFDMKKVRII